MPRPLHLLILLVALGLLYLTFLSDVGLIGPDEPRYAAIGRQMARSGDWVTPVLWSKPWYEKPALLYWLIGAGNLLGLGPELAPRLPIALLAIGFVLYFFRTLQRAFPDSPSPLYSAIILATSAGWVAFGFSPVTDLPLTVCLGVAVLAVIFECPVWLAGLSLGLAVLAKGLVPWVLFFPAIVWLFWQRRWQRASAIVALSVATAAPWYLLCYLRNGWPFIEEFFIRHHFQRFSTDVLRHVQPWYYYLPVMLGLLFPWTPLYFTLFRKHIFEDRRIRFLGLWILWGLLFFSISKNKLGGYVLPLVPAVAVLLGFAVERAPRALLALCGALLAVIPALEHILAPALEHGLSKTSLAGPPWWGWALGAAAGALFWLLRDQRLAMTAFACLFTAAALHLKSAASPALDRLVTARQEARKGMREPCLDHSQRDRYYGMNYYLDVREKLPVCGDVETPP